MSKFKSPFESTGVWGSVIVLLTSIFSMLGITLNPEEVTTWLESGWAIYVNATIIIGGLTSLWGRIRATKKINLG